jgi:hypothetical protein
MAIERPVRWTGGDGAVATLANTGFDFIFPQGGTMTFTDDWKPRHAQVVLDANGTTTAGYVLGVNDITATDVIAFDQPVQPKAIAPSEVTLVFFGAGETRQFSVVSMSDGSVMVRNGAAANAWRSAAGVLAPGIPIVLSIYLTRDAANGTFRVVVYEADGVTVRLGSDSGLKTAQNTGSLPITRIKHTIAKSSSSSTVVARHWFGEPRWDRSATGLLPAWTERNPFRTVVNGEWKPVKLYTVVNGSWLALH